MTIEATPVLVLTNDDGVDAPGLGALREAAGPFGARRVVAPAGPWSGRGHAVTTDLPIRIERRGEGCFAIDGTPADCVRLALHHLAGGAAWVLSGINAGANLGVDVHHSGTVAAAREAVIHGVPAIALSHYIRRGVPLDWPRAARRAAEVLRQLLGRAWEPGTFWNVNLPHLEPGAPDPPLVFCDLDPSPLPLSFRVDAEAAHYNGDYHHRARRPGSDVDVCFGGRIAVTRVPVFPPAGAVT